LLAFPPSLARHLTVPGGAGETALLTSSSIGVSRSASRATGSGR